MPEPVLLTQGTKTPDIICLPSVVALAGVHQYDLLAAEFTGSHAIRVLPAPGYSAGQPLPETLAALVATHAATIAARQSGDFVLLGHSSGGWIASAVTAELERRGTPPSALILIDTYHPEHETFDRVLPAAIPSLLERGHDLVDDTWITAMGGYLRLFADWTPEPVTTPTLLIRAADPMKTMSTDADWRAYWPTAQTVTEVPGDHFTILEDHAAVTAQTIRTWLTDPYAQRTPR